MVQPSMSPTNIARSYYLPRSESRYIPPRPFLLHISTLAFIPFSRIRFCPRRSRTPPDFDNTGRVSFAEIQIFQQSRIFVSPNYSLSPLTSPLFYIVFQFSSATRWNLSARVLSRFLIKSSFAYCAFPLYCSAGLASHCMQLNRHRRWTSFETFSIRKSFPSRAFFPRYEFFFTLLRARTFRFCTGVFKYLLASYRERGTLDDFC